MIRVRDDDVLLHSSGWEDPAGRFRGVHKMIKGDLFIHVPAILVKEIQQFPEIIEYVREETAEGFMRPELHGLQHIDYGVLPLKEVRDHLDESMEWMEENLNVTPGIWYTPWGASQPHLHEAAGDYELALIDCSDILPQKNLVNAIRKRGRQAMIDHSDGEIFMHWWESVGRLNRIINTYRLDDPEVIKSDDEREQREDPDNGAGV